MPPGVLITTIVNNIYKCNHIFIDTNHNKQLLQNNKPFYENIDLKIMFFC